MATYKGQPRKKRIPKDAAEVAKGLREIVENTKAFAVGDSQREMVEVLALATLCGEHSVFIGPPGTNKSNLIRYWAEHLQCVTDPAQRVFQVKGKSVRKPFLFSCTLDKFMTPESLLGAFDPRKMRDKGEWVRNLQNTAADAHFLHLSEIFAASGQTLRSLVRLLNEREVENGGAVLPCPLLSCFADSNSLPMDEAVFDRFLFRTCVTYVRQNEVEALLSAPERTAISNGATILSVGDVKRAQREVAAIQITPQQLALLGDLRMAASKANVVISDRRLRKIVHALKAAAYMRGASCVAGRDFHVLNWTAWTKLADREHIHRFTMDIIAKADPDIASVKAKMDECVAVFERGDVSDTDRFATTAQTLGQLANTFPQRSPEREEARTYAQELIERVKRSAGL